MSIASNLSFSTATSILAGTAGAIVYQSGVNTTAFLSIGTNGFVLTSNGSAPAWSAVGSLTAGNATTASNIALGTAGQLLYQSSPGVTAFAGPGSNGQFLMSTGAAAPVYQSTLTQANGNIVITSNSASTSTTTGALQVINGGVGVGGSVYVGNRVGFVNASNISAVYQVYNAATNSLDTVFG
jgi:hypothetical protein